MDDRTDDSLSDVLPVTLSLRVHFCGECALAFAVPESLFISVAHERGSIHCPRGHANPIVEDPAESSAAMLVALAALVTARAHVRELTRRLAAFAPPDVTPPSDAELVRRARVLVERAEDAKQYGRRVCKFCGKNKSPAVLRRHLLDAHKHELAAMPAQVFE